MLSITVLIFRQWASFIATVNLSLIQIIWGDMKNIFSVTYQETGKLHKKGKGSRSLVIHSGNKNITHFDTNVEKN